ncbi:MAG: UDP-N-acetylmuramate dehydrogenase [Candidatus Eremiobacteraeota bacterium]|nr:UDP-N-acetylmuramate dehydrogenase [Candidatus Eremiobacteraeota bacterium]
MKDLPGLKQNEPMSGYTTFHVGGLADYFITCTDEEHLLQAVEWAGNKKIPVFILGEGSNILVSDRGIEGIVIKLGGKFEELRWQKSGIIAGCAVSLPELSRQCSGRGLGGLEFARGIPGSLGGALIMNAGAYGHFIEEVVRSVRLFYDNEIIEIEKDRINFGYRESGFPDSSILLFADLELKREKPDVLEKIAEEYIKKRRARQPLGAWSAGCIFRNPPGEKAWELIEKSSAHSLKVGDAEVSDVHKNFIINRRNASAAQIWELICKVKDRVRLNTGIELELEIKRVGRW